MATIFFSYMVLPNSPLWINHKLEDKWHENQLHYPLNWLLPSRYSRTTSTFWTNRAKSQCCSPFFTARLDPCDSIVPNSKRPCLTCLVALKNIALNHWLFIKMVWYGCKIWSFHVAVVQGRPWNLQVRNRVVVLLITPIAFSWRFCCCRRRLSRDLTIRQRRRPWKRYWKIDSVSFQTISRFCQVALLLTRREFRLELKRGGRARVQTEMVEFIVLPFPSSKKN